MRASAAEKSMSISLSFYFFSWHRPKVFISHLSYTSGMATIHFVHKLLQRPLRLMRRSVAERRISVCVHKRERGRKKGRGRWRSNEIRRGTPWKPTMWSHHLYKLVRWNGTKYKRKIDADCEVMHCISLHMCKPSHYYSQGILFGSTWFARYVHVQCFNSLWCPT